jgi:NAD(P)-dependent dehydrogenase (short-subunit alcohol dehydrogenase family)
MLLKGKTAVIYGGGGSIGGAVARVFGREGATVHLAGRTEATLQRVAEEIRADGGTAHTAVVDALDAEAVNRHADAIGHFDISFNAINHNDIQGTPMADMEVEDYLSPIVTGVRTNFLTWKAAAKHGAQVILVFGGSGPPTRDYSLGGLQTGLEALESMRRQFSTENRGIRVVTMRTGGVGDAIPDTFEGRDALIADLEGQTLSGRLATFEDVGNVAAFVASDRARTMTAATVNVSCGALID